MISPDFSRRIISVSGRYLTPLFSDVLSSDSAMHLQRNSELAYDITAHNERLEVFPISDGIVRHIQRATSAPNDGGYGVNVIIDHGELHAWYCHLELNSIKDGIGVGSRVFQNRSFARVGATGHTTFPNHVHMILLEDMVNYNRLRPEDFWPVDLFTWMPYATSNDLDIYDIREKPVYTGSLVGSHIIGEINPLMEDLNKWKPRLILALDRSPDELQRLKDSNPLNCLVNRRYVPDSEMDQRIRDNPSQAALFVHDKISESRGWAADYHIIENEVVQTPESPHKKLIEYAYHRMDLADNDNYKCALFGFGVGHLHMPEDDRFFYWRKFVPVLKECANRGHVLCIHQYGSTSFSLPNREWYSMRFEYQVADWLFDQIPNLKYVVTELGLNQAVGAPPGTPHSGYRDFMSPEQYNRELIDYAQHPQIQKYARRNCIGYSIFTHGSTADWASKDIHPEVAAMQADYGSQHQIEMDVGSIVEPLYQVKVIAQGLNFRDAPTTNGNVIRVLPNGEVLDVMDDVDQPWLNLRDSSGMWGFASTGQDWVYLEKIEDTLPPETDLEKRVSQNEIDISNLQGRMTKTELSLGNLMVDMLALERRVESLENNDGGTSPIPDRRYSQSISYLGQSIVSIVGEPNYRVLHAWTTHNGQWEVDPSDIYAVEQWARDLYLKSNSGEDGFGGETHIFARVQDKQGRTVPTNIEFRWPDGVAMRTTGGANGWTNVPITGSFVPDRGEEGVWTVAAQNNSEVFGRFALPSNQHVSLYVVFEV